MSAEKLAFLQNFYTDVTLYMPAEPVAAAPVAAPSTAAGPTAAAPVAAPPLATGPVASAPVATRETGTQLAAAPTAAAAPDAGKSAGLAEQLAQPDAAPTRPGLPKSIPTAAQVKLTDRLAGAAAPAAPVAPAPVGPANVPPVLLTPFATLGDNAQGIVMLFRLPREEFVKLHRNVFLNKMLQALGYVMADVMLVNVESELPVALSSLRQRLAATHIIAFGKNLLDATIRNTQIYEPVQFPSLGFSYLASATVDLVEYDVTLKKRLWPGLQRMFLN